MKRIDVRFDDTMICHLRAMIGKTFLKYKCDPFIITSSAFGIVGIVTEQGSFAITNTIHVLDYFGADEDVAVLELCPLPETEMRSMLKGVMMTDHAIGRQIIEIRVINENKRLFEQGKQIYDVCLTRGLIFVLTDGYEVAFEKQTWFSEMMSIHEGHNLIDKFVPTSEFCKDWDPRYRAECERQTVVLR